MNVIRVCKQIDSETLHLPELKEMTGKRAEIVVRVEPVVSPATEEDWEEFFAENRPPLIDADLYRHG